MEIERKGGNCVVISHKKYDIVIDPKVSPYGLKDQGAQAAAHLLTQHSFSVPTGDETVVIDGPGEYEVHNCSVVGVATRPHSQPNDAPKTATMYRLDIDDCRIAVLGHTQPKLEEADLEVLGVIDILILPVGGHGYTLEPKEAVDLVRSIEPRIVIPTHYQEEGVVFEVLQAPLTDFLKELGASSQEETPKLKIKSGQLPDTLTVCELTRTK